LAQNLEAAEKSEHPLNRIVGIEEIGNALMISTTDIHLRRRIGEALKSASHGELDMDFDNAGYLCRLTGVPRSEAEMACSIRLAGAAPADYGNRSGSVLRVTPPVPNGHTSSTRPRSMSDRPC
jgi:hypothetical protein